MKNLIIVLVILFVFSGSAHAQMGMMGGQQGQMGQSTMMGEGQQMPMMEKCQQMMGQGMMMQDMMQMMMDMMNMQGKMMKGIKASEKKEMIMEMDKMRDKMEKMMSMHMGMMMGLPSDDPRYRLNCAEQWLKKAIDLHELHMKDPKTTTEASQIELMDQIKKAYECVTGIGFEMSRVPLKEPETNETKEKPSKGDIHGH